MFIVLFIASYIFATCSERVYDIEHATAKNLKIKDSVISKGPIKKVAPKIPISYDSQKNIAKDLEVGHVNQTNIEEKFKVETSVQKKNLPSRNDLLQEIRDKRKKTFKKEASDPLSGKNSYCTASNTAIGCFNNSKMVENTSSYLENKYTCNQNQSFKKNSEIKTFQDIPNLYNYSSPYLERETAYDRNIPDGEHMDLIVDDELNNIYCDTKENIVNINDMNSKETETEDCTESICDYNEIDRLTLRNTASNINYYQEKDFEPNLIYDSINSKSKKRPPLPKKPAINRNYSLDYKVEPEKLKQELNQIQDLSISTENCKNNKEDKNLDKLNSYFVNACQKNFLRDSYSESSINQTDELPPYPFITEDDLSVPEATSTKALPAEKSFINSRKNSLSSSYFLEGAWKNCENYNYGLYNTECRSFKPLEEIEIEELKLKRTSNNFIITANEVFQEKINNAYKEYENFLKENIKQKTINKTNITNILNGVLKTLKAASINIEEAKQSNIKVETKIEELDEKGKSRYKKELLKNIKKNKK